MTKYVYFVSFVHTTEEGTAFGNCCVEGNKKVAGEYAITLFQNGIAKKHGWEQGSVVLLGVTLLDEQRRIITPN